MIYDWKKTLKVPEERREFFEEIDRRFFDAAFFAHQRGGVLFSNLIDYKAFRGKRVLEIGCGAGAISAIFSREGALISSIDLTHTAVERTRLRFGIYQLKGNILQMDAEAMGFKNEIFIFVWSWGAVHHSEDTERIISEIYRVLKPKGKIAIMVYNRNSIYFWIYLMLFRGVFSGKFIAHSVREICNFYSDGLIAKYYTRKQLIKIFQENKFSDIKVQVFGQKSDIYLLPRNIRAWFIRLIPKSITDWLAYNFGRFLYLTATKAG